MPLCPSGELGEACREAKLLEFKMLVRKGALNQKQFNEFMARNSRKNRKSTRKNRKANRKNRKNTRRN
jgi:hypothetical protein